MDSFAQRTAQELQTIVKARGFTHERIAAQLDVSDAWVQRRLSGALPMSLDDAASIARVVGYHVALEIVRYDVGTMTSRGVTVES